MFLEGREPDIFLEILTITAIYEKYAFAVPVLQKRGHKHRKFMGLTLGHTSNKQNRVTRFSKSKYRTPS
jgi:hypothetical protein